jgi:hypothetical protein
MNQFSAMAEHQVVLLGDSEAGADEMKNATTPTYEDRAAKSLHARESQDNVVSPSECGSQTKRCNGGRPKKWVKPTAERLRQDFVSAARGRTALNATKIVERMKIECPAYASIPSATIVRWLPETGISVKAIKRSIKAE